MSAGFRIDGVSVRLGRREVLREVSLELRPGRMVAVIGPNGAGKSTLLRACAGLIRPRAGSILLGGTPVDRIAPGERARRIAYLPQGGAVAWPLPVATVAALGRIPHGEALDRLPADGRRAVARALSEAGLQGFEARPATELSGGERARLLLARALATESPAILADEPVAALDPRHQLLVLERLRARARGGALVAVVMHDLALAARFADDAVLLAEGMVRAAGTVDAVFSGAELGAAFGVEIEVRRGLGGPDVVLRRALPG